MTEIELKNYSFKACIDWIDIEFFTGETSNGNGLREMLNAKARGVTHVRDVKTETKSAPSNHFIVRIQNPTKDRLAKIEGTHTTNQGKVIKIKFGAIKAIEFALDVNHRNLNEIPALELMAHYLTKTLHFKDTLTRKYRFWTGGKRESKVSKDTTLYVGQQSDALSVRLYIKTVDDGDAIKTPRCRLEFTTRQAMLPCHTIAELSGINWDRWLFETIKYLPRLPTRPEFKLPLWRLITEDSAFPLLIGDTNGRFNKRGNALKGEVFLPPSRSVLIAPDTLPQHAFVRRIRKALKVFEFT